MKARDEIEEFIETLSLSKRNKSDKKRYLLQFADYLEFTEELTGDWNFNKVEKLIYGHRVFRGPVRPKLVADFLTSIHSKISGSTYNKYLFAIMQFFDYLMDKELIVENPATEIERKQTKKHNMRPYRLTLREAVLILKAAYQFDEHRNRNFCLALTLLSTATRIGELVKLSVTDINFYSSIIYADGKTNERRRFLTPGLIESLNEYLKDPLRITALASSNPNLVFYSSKGGPLTPKEANNLLKLFAAKAGIDKNISTYWLRRTFATILAQNNFSLVEIQEIYDHDEKSSTEKYTLDFFPTDIGRMVNESPIADMLHKVVRNHMKQV